MMGKVVKSYGKMIGDGTLLGKLRESDRGVVEKRWGKTMGK